MNDTIYIFISETGNFIDVIRYILFLLMLYIINWSIKLTLLHTTYSHEYSCSFLCIKAGNICNSRAKISIIISAFVSPVS